MAQWTYLAQKKKSALNPIKDWLGKIDGKIAFGTSTDRESWPTEAAKDRFSNSHCPISVSGAKPGPGSYEIEDKTNFVHHVNSRPISNKGYTMGARTGPRYRPENKSLKNPCPTEYQQTVMEPRTFEPAVTGVDRFPFYKSDLQVTPGVGSYDIDKQLNKKVEWEQSFGEKPLNLPRINVPSTIALNTIKLSGTKHERKYNRKLAYLKLYY